jgi:hypothetical protein
MINVLKGTNALTAASYRQALSNALTAVGYRQALSKALTAVGYRQALSNALSVSLSSLSNHSLLQSSSQYITLKPLHITEE